MRKLLMVVLSLLLVGCTTKEETKKAKTYKNESIALKSGHEYSYDLDKNGKKDKLIVTHDNHELSDEGHDLTVTLNGVSETIVKGNGYYNADVNLYRMETGEYALLVVTHIDNDYGTTYLYHFSNNKLMKDYESSDFIDEKYGEATVADEIKLSGNTLTLEQDVRDYTFNDFHIKMYFIYKNRCLQTTTNTYEFISDVSKSFTLEKDKKVYKGSLSDEVLYEAKKGEKVEVKEVFIKNRILWFKVTKDNQTGYIRALDSKTLIDKKGNMHPLFKEVVYAG